SRLERLDGRLPSGAKQAFQVLVRDARRVFVEAEVIVQPGRPDGRDVEDVGLRPELRVEGQRHLPLADELGDRSILVVERAEPDGAAGALAHAGGSDALLHTREAHDALLADLPHEVEVDLLVGAGLQAELIAAAAALIPQDDAVLLALIHGVAGAGVHAGGRGAVIAEAGYVEVVGVGVFAGALVLVPVGAPLGLLAHMVEEDGLALAAVEDLVVVELPAAAPL